MACETLVQLSKDGYELLKQTGPNPLLYSNFNSTMWMKLYGPSRPCGQDGGHSVLRSHYVVQYLLVSAYDPVLSTALVPCTSNCRGSMPCASRNLTV